jgi:hypothetical protein
VVVEHCADDTDRICFTTKALSQATIDKIHRADQACKDFEDIVANMDAEERAREREIDHNLSEAMIEVSERMYYALRKDGVIHRPAVYF